MRNPFQFLTSAPFAESAGLLFAFFAGIVILILLAWLDDHPLRK